MGTTVEKKPLRMAAPLVRTLSPSLARQLSGEGPVETFQCYICGFEEVPKDADSIQLTACGHTVHRPCWKEYLAFTVKNSQGRQPVCNRPKFDGAEWDYQEQDHVGGKCMTAFTDEDIRELIDDEVYDQFLRLREQNADPNIRTCEQCGTCMPGDPAVLKMTCSQLSCGHVFCYEHGDACQLPTAAMSPESNFEQRCQAFDGDKENMAYIAKEVEKGNIKLCPHCNTPVSKTSGCNAMTCSNCDNGFCWLCGDKIVDSHGLPPHFSTLNTTSGCAGKQFVTEDGEGVAGPPLTGCESYWACTVACACFVVMGPVLLVYGILSCILSMVMGIIYACLQPVVRICFHEACLTEDGEEDRSQLQCLVGTLMGSLGCAILLPVACVLSPCWLPFAIYVRRRNQRWAEEQLLLAEAEGADEAVSLEESQARTMAAEQVSVHIREQAEADGNNSDSLDHPDVPLLLAPVVPAAGRFQGTVVAIKKAKV